MSMQLWVSGGTSGSGGGVTNVTASSPLASSGGATPNITINSSTGSGAVVLATSPTIVTPTVASFTNATHNHQNAAGGGTLDLTAIGGATILPPANGGVANISTALQGGFFTHGQLHPLPTVHNGQHGPWEFSKYCEGMAHRYSRPRSREQSHCGHWHHGG